MANRKIVKKRNEREIIKHERRREENSLKWLEVKHFDDTKKVR